MCAIFGVIGAGDAAALTAVGLHGNQHRAQDYAGMASFEQGKIHLVHGSGLARQVFTQTALDALHGTIALGHLRYPTVADNPDLVNIQPIRGMYGGMPFALAHNGNITNVDDLRSQIRPGVIKTSMDSEIIVRLLELMYSGDLEQDLSAVLRTLQGSFALGLIFPDRLVAVSGPSRNRPLYIAPLNGGYCISSETCVFPTFNIHAYEQVSPGTFVTVRSGDPAARTVSFARPDPHHCVFESVYFAHPASDNGNGESVARYRIRLGQALEKHCPAPGAELVMPVPDSSTMIAVGYGSSGKSGMYFPGIVRSHYVGRTFIGPTNDERINALADKFAFSSLDIRGKKLVIIDDSIVRGSTMKRIVRVLRQCGAAEIHVRIACPPVRHPCRYGINTRTYEELTAADQSVEEICAMIDATTLQFLPLEVLKSLQTDPQSCCFACWDGKYW